jgi:hypothetical protein
MAFQPNNNYRTPNWGVSAGPFSSGMSNPPVYNQDDDFGGPYYNPEGYGFPTRAPARQSSSPWSLDDSGYGYNPPNTRPGQPSSQWTMGNGNSYYPEQPSYNYGYEPTTFLQNAAYANVNAFGGSGNDNFFQFGYQSDLSATGNGGMDNFVQGAVNNRGKVTRAQGTGTDDWIVQVTEDGNLEANAGAGSDFIAQTLRRGSSVINAGAGDDRILIAGEDAQFVVNGGGGNDTVTLTGKPQDWVRQPNGAFVNAKLRITVTMNDITTVRYLGE